LFLRGLTALDALNEATLGTRPTMSHVAARQEVEVLLSAIGLREPSTDMQAPEKNCDAA
jgi:chromosome partitioning protein